MSVSISDEKGRLLEWLEAVHLEEDWWERVPHVEGRIAAHAWDISGNRSRLELE